MTNTSTGCNRLILVQILPYCNKTIKAAPRHVIAKDEENLQKQHDIIQGLIIYGQSA
jgi:hypothetical protein